MTTKTFLRLLENLWQVMDSSKPGIRDVKLTWCLSSPQVYHWGWNRPMYLAMYRAGFLVELFPSCVNMLYTSARNHFGELPGISYIYLRQICIYIYSDLWLTCNASPQNHYHHASFEVQNQPPVYMQCGSRYNSKIVNMLISWIHCKYGEWCFMRKPSNNVFQIFFYPF